MLGVCGRTNLCYVRSAVFGAPKRSKPMNLKKALSKALKDDMGNAADRVVN